MTVMELVEKYQRQRPPARYNTVHAWKFVRTILERTGFGALRIDCIKRSDAKEFLIYLQERGKLNGTGYSHGSVTDVAKVLRPRSRWLSTMT